MLQEGATALEALGIAIRNEIDAQALYQDLASLAKDEVLKERFLNLHQEERRYRLLLEKKYREMFPGVDLQIPPSQLPIEIHDENLNKNLTLKDVLEIAINAEKTAREFYLDCAETTPDLSGKRMFRFLADMRFSHQMILAAELEIIEKYPAYYRVTKDWEAETTLKKEKMKRGRT
jgi:rubrerythrin